MGILSEVVAYKIGKRRGRRKAERQMRYAGSPEVGGRDPECLNYQSFCQNFGSCNGMACEYEDEE